MLLYCNERRLTIPTDKPIIDSIKIIDKQYELERFEFRKQIVVDSTGKEIKNLSKTPNELGLNPDSTIYITNPPDNRFI
jgi:hypothetical protein